MYHILPNRCWSKPIWITCLDRRVFPWTDVFPPYLSQAGVIWLHLCKQRAPKCSHLILKFSMTRNQLVFRCSHSLVENQPLVGGSMLFAVFNDVYSHRFETPAVLAAAALSLYMSLDLLLTWSHPEVLSSSQTWPWKRLGIKIDDVPSYFQLFLCKFPWWFDSHRCDFIPAISHLEMCQFPWGLSPIDTIDVEVSPSHFVQHLLRETIGFTPQVCIELVFYLLMGLAGYVPRPPAMIRWWSLSWP